jgi:biopolymer transport protein TolR
MSMDTGGPKGGIKADINVTPLVDVMLVLLIIMMIVAPMLNGGNITLPTANYTTDKPDTQDQIVVMVDANSHLLVNMVECADPADALAKVTAALEKSKERVVYLKGDRDAPYGAIMKMMDVLRKAQIDGVGLITERPGGTVNEKKGGN